MNDGSRTQSNMAGSVNSDEIEDVLSSIRRLVSEDLRPAPRPQIVAGQVGTVALGPALIPRSVTPEPALLKPNAGEKLILTPALRVVSSRPVPRLLAEIPGQTPARPLSVMPAQPPIRPSAEVTALPRLHLGAGHEVTRRTPELVATLAQGVDQKRPLDWESETGDPEPDLGSLDWSSFTFARRSMQETWVARVVANEVTAPFAAHVDSATKGLATKSWAQPDPGEGSAPEAPMAEDVTDLPSDWADQAEAGVLADLNRDQRFRPDMKQPESHQPEAEVIPGTQQEEDSIFSEQVLRELVRDLIREQLQGDLGERITRNIRKLVRAEIAQAMSVHSLE